MSGARLLPHRNALNAVDWGQWLVGVNSNDLVPVPERIAGWDYQSQLTFELRPRVNTEHLMQSTGIQDQTAVRLVALVDCKASNRRFSAMQDLSGEPNPCMLMRIDVPSGEVAGQVELSAHLVLGRELAPQQNGVARRLGSRLDQSAAVRVTLEGDGSRFPTEVASFAALGLERALWSVQVEPNGLDTSFAGCARLFINTDLPASEGLLDSDIDSVTFRFLQMDVARQLIKAVIDLDCPEADLMAEWDEGTLGRAAQELAREFLGTDLMTCTNYAKSDPTRFERVLQNAFAPWEVG